MTAYADMNKLSPILKEEPKGWLHFWCPGCDRVHTVNVRPENHSVAWGWNGSPDKPTFTPSILTRSSPRKGSAVVCHSFVTDGRIQFLGDCTHELAGQTVELPAWD